MKRAPISPLVAWMPLFLCLSAQGLEVSNLRCEYRQNPSGLDVKAPRLSWVLAGNGRSERQSAYRVLVASSPALLGSAQTDLWDSGKVASDQTIHVVYAGRPLVSRQRVWWSVQVWDQRDRASQWSKPASWSMGLLEAADWSAQWVGDPVASAPAEPRGPLNGFHSGFSASADAVKWVLVDLGQPRLMDGVRLCPARPYDWQPDTPGFLFPMRYRIEASETPAFDRPRLLVDRSTADEPSPGTEAVGWHFDETTARYVRLTVTRLRPRDPDKHAFALTEFEVMSGTTNLARRSRVTASDSIETGSWAAVNLTDGVSRTVPPSTTDRALPATMMRKSFVLPGSIQRATAYVTANGLYELRINGRRVGQQLLSPEWTNYRRRCQYQTHDVT